MNDLLNPPPADSEPTPVKLSLWRKIGGGALSIAVLFHVALLIVGSIWIFTIIREPEKKVDFVAGGSSGSGERSAQSKQKEKQRAKITPTTSMKRVAVEGPSSLTLADPGDTVGTMASLGAIGGGGLSGGFGGGGKGKGLGEGTGAGSGISGLAGDPSKLNPFGSVDPNANALEGSFYDLKQTRDRKPTDMTVDGMREFIRDYVNSGWKDKSLEKYYRAERTLNQTRFRIPLMQASAAPTAFECEKEVQPARWLVVYRGVVTPPKSGRYRFVGAADDAMVIRFNGQHVFDHGYTAGTMGIDLYRNKGFFKGESENDDLKKLARRDYPMKVPVTYYTYANCGDWNKNINGIAVGAEFEAKLNTAYPIEILISEIPGGLFGAALFIEEVGAKYEKTPEGSPILPLFRLDSNLPAVDPKDQNAPPFDANGPVWKRMKGPSHMEI